MFVCNLKLILGHLTYVGVHTILSVLACLFFKENITMVPGQRGSEKSSNKVTTLWAIMALLLKY